MKWLLSIPLQMIALAVICTLGFVVVHWLGWRDATTILSGTFPTANHTWDAVRALTYLVFYFGCVVASPILVLAAAALACLERMFLRERET